MKIKILIILELKVSHSIHRELSLLSTAWIKLPRRFFRNVNFLCSMPSVIFSVQNKNKQNPARLVPFIRAMESILTSRLNASQTWGTPRHKWKCPKSLKNLSSVYRNVISKVPTFIRYFPEILDSKHWLREDQNYLWWSIVYKEVIRVLPNLKMLIQVSLRFVLF